MKAKQICILATVVLLAANDFNKTAAQSDIAKQSDGRDTEAWKAYSDMGVSTKDAFDKSQQALEKIDSLRSLTTVPRKVALPAAEGAFLLGSPARAIAIMERVIQEYPNERMPKLSTPVNIGGNFWIGTFARYAGNPTRAEAAYRDVLTRLKANPNVKSPSLLAAMCYLYLAEIEIHFRNRPDKAAEFLREMAAIPKTNDKEENSALDVYQAWGQHMLRHTASQPWVEASISRVVQPPYGDPSIVPISHMTITGLIDSGDLGGISVAASGKSSADVMTYSLEKVLDSKVSPIDTALAQLLLGRHYELGKKDVAKARQYYEAIFQGDSYLAPEGGLAVSRCWRLEKELDKAKQILEEVVRRFPVYKGQVDRLRQQMSSNSKSE